MTLIILFFYSTGSPPRPDSTSHSSFIISKIFQKLTCPRRNRRTKHGH